MTTDADKIRFLAELAGWAYEHKRFHPWHHAAHGYRDFAPDYPHSLDAIDRDLLPLLRERGWAHELLWEEDYSFFVWLTAETGVCRSNPELAHAAFEAIYEALHGGKE